MPKNQQTKRSTRAKRSSRKPKAVVELEPMCETSEPITHAEPPPPNDLAVFQEFRSHLEHLNYSIQAHKTTIQELLDNRAILISRLRELQEKIQAETHLPPNL